MKRFTLASFIIVLMAGFWLFPGNSTAQLFQASSLFSYSAPYSVPYSVPSVTGWSTSDLSNPMNTRSASSILPATNANINGFLGINLASSWSSSLFSTNLSSNLSSSLSLYPSASYFSLASPIPQLSLSNQLYLGNQTPYGNQISYSNQIPYSNQFLSQNSNQFSSQTSLDPWRTANSYIPQQTTLFPADIFPGPFVPVTQAPKVVKLDYKVKTDKAEYGPQEPVQITFTVTNSDKDKADISFSSSQQFDVIVKDSSQAKVWQLSSGMRYAMSATNCKLAAGESKEYQAKWDKSPLIPAGSYTIEAFLTPTDKNYGQTASTTITIVASVTVTEPLPRFSSCTKLREKLDEITNSSAVKGGFYAYGALAIDAVAAPGERVAAATMNTATTGSAGASADDYSTTNVQVEGVDEADRIKNDGAYIYMIKGNSIRIIKAYPADQMKEMPKIDFAGSSFTPSQLYVDGDTLIVVGNDYPSVENSASPVSEVGIMTTAIRAPAYYPSYIRQSSLTRVIIYDITDRARVTEKRNLNFEGTYLQSRRVDDTLYVIMNQYPQYVPMVPVDKNPVPLDTPEMMIPRYADSTRSSNDKVDTAICDCEEVSYFPGSMESRYLIVVAIPINDPAGKIGKEVVLGSSENVYSSISNLYVAHTSYTDDENTADKNTAAAVYPYYSSNPKTEVYKFSLNHENIQYEAKAKVPGTIINQFAMDEYDYNMDGYGNYFRIATTKGQTLDESNPSSNNLYVLNNNMEQVGSIENIAPGESIKSVRFMGDKAYVVTFLQIDPLFVISLTDPTHPVILGQLKIPGYSEYLHPYDETHIIGFGRDVDASIDADKIHSANAVYYTAVLGMKISMFDVTDVEHPKELFKEIIGYRNTSSELLTDHKALLFSKAKNIMAFPVTVTEKIENATDDYNNYAFTFQGALFYNIDMTSGPKRGFNKKAAITHYNNDDEFNKAGYYFYGGEDDIRRIIYIGDFYYTISDSKVKAVNMQTYREGDMVILEKSDDSVTQPYLGGKVILF